MEKETLSLDAIGELYSANHGWLLRWLYRRLGCTHNAADIAQDTFTRLLSGRDALYLNEAKALLTLIAKGLVIDHFRRYALETAYLEALTLLPESQVPSAESQAILLETLIEIDRMLDNLKPKVRKAFLLSQLDGLSYAEIAAQMGVSVASVQKYMTKGYAACYAVAYPQSGK